MQNYLDDILFFFILGCLACVAIASVHANTPYVKEHYADYDKAHKYSKELIK